MSVGMPPDSKREMSLEQFISVYAEFRDYLKHEDGHINERISRTMLLHGFLLAAYSLLVQSISDVLSKPLGVQNSSCVGKELASCLPPELTKFLLGAENLSILIAAIGLVAAIGSWLGIIAAQSAIRKLRNNYALFVSGNELVHARMHLPALTGGGSWLNEWLGLFSTHFLPGMTFILWALVLVNATAPERINPVVDALKRLAGLLF